MCNHDSGCGKGIDMKTPIVNFVKEYAENNMTRFHMPGHKGKSFLGCEEYDITEVKGADALYETDGIIAESEANATELFDTARTLFSTEGSSQCIRAMMYLVVNAYKGKKKPVVLAARNVHKAFLYAAALVDFDVKWLWPKEMHSICSCEVSAEMVEETLAAMEEVPAAVYITSPDYLGGQADIRGIAEICHKHGTILAVDNAHGAYLHFLKKTMHPIDLGADICCDSAHKTLPVLTGGAYLQISKHAPESFVRNAKQAMVLFGSTSPSYLTLSSLDLCNRYLNEMYRARLTFMIGKIQSSKRHIRENGWIVEETEPLKITIKTPAALGGIRLAEMLRNYNIESEYADENYLVCMISPENYPEELDYLVECLGENVYGAAADVTMSPLRSEQIISIREAMFAEREHISIKDAEGRICGAPAVSCPPAIPIVVSGEKITAEAIEIFQYYGITEVEVIKK